MSIPKIIHYCWFGGGKKPELALKCIESWKKFCPDYQIIEWNESNFNINYCDYTREAYQTKKWAFVSDVARLYALVSCGGIYMDTDVEVVKPLDIFLNNKAFSGFESDASVSTCIMGSVKGQGLFAEFLSDYENKRFISKDNAYDLTTNVVRITNICLKYGLVCNNRLQTINGFTLYPKDYFCPKDYETKVLNITENTHTIHHFDGSWIAPEDKLRDAYFLKLKKWLPKKLAIRLSIFFAIKKTKGMKAALKKCFKHFRKGNKP